MATLEDVLLPDIGDFAEVEIIEILVAPGERVEPDQSLLTLESDKASMEIPSPLAGTVREIRVSVGDSISQGALLMTIETGGAADTAPAALPGDDAVNGQAATEQPASAAAAGTVVEPPPEPPAQPPPAQPPPAEPPPAQAPPQPTTMPAGTSDARPIEVHLPDIGDFADIPVIEVLVAEGDEVDLEQSVLTLESDKATMEIPSSAAGTVQSVAVKVGDKLNRGDLLMTLLASAQPASAQAATPEAAVATGTAASEEQEEQAPAPAAKPKPAAGRMPGDAERRKAPVLTRPTDMAAITPGRRPHASPAVRRFARELGVDLGKVKGSGRKSRILKDDVQGFVKQALSAGASAPAAAGLPFQLPAAPEVDFSRFGEIDAQPLPRIKRISGAHLHRCWLSVPHVTQFDEADITELEAFRKQQRAEAEKSGVKLTFMPFLLKAVAGALSQMPNVKASLAPDGEQLIVKHYTHIGVAVDTPNGLVVPVVRDVDKKGMLEIARELMQISAKARDGKLLPGDMQGGVFTISSLGGIGGTAFTPIVNAPEVAILGVSRSEMKPLWNGSEFVPRLMLPLSLSYDHRVVDGAEGARFTTLLAGLLADIRRLLL